jgi:uncharacterized protein (DUF2062 family)
MQSLRDLALRGMSPEAMALSIALGFALGLFPVPGCPTLLCALAALILRLNGPAVQAVNYLVCPLQLALFAPFMRVGGRLFPAPARHLPAMLHGGAWRAVAGVLAAAAHAVAGWLCIGAPAGLLLYILLAYCLRRRGRARAATA